MEGVKGGTVYVCNRSIIVGGVTATTLQLLLLSFFQNLSHGGNGGLVSDDMPFDILTPLF